MMILRLIVPFFILLLAACGGGSSSEPQEPASICPGGDPVAVTFEAGFGGTVSPAGTQNVCPGSPVTVNITTDADYVIDVDNSEGCGIEIVGGAGTELGGSFTSRGNVTSTCTFTANFTQVPFGTALVTAS